MRVGIDAHSAESDGTGNCTYIRNLILELTKLDETNEYVLFVANRNHPFYETIESRPNVEIVSLGPYPAWLRVFYLLPVAAYREKVDLLHVQYFAPYGSTRLVNTIHDGAWLRFPEYFSRFERLIFQLLVPLSAKRAKVILTSSATARNDLIELMHLPPEKVKVTYNAVSPIFSSTGFEKHRILDVCEGFGLNRGFVLYVGRIDPRKNLVRLIEAYSFFRSRYSLDQQLAIVGKVHLEPDSLQKALEKCEYRDDIRFCGYVSEKDLSALYRAADVFTYVSEYEGFGLPPLEAMASGTPVVASDIPIFREILGDAALLVNPFDVAAIGEAIYKLIADQTCREKFIEKGKNRVKDFSWQKTARVTLHAYQDAMK
jgi:glycosyltransferase involved in cell wall biosynthesis